MKAIVSLTNLVIDIKNLAALDSLLKGCVDRQDYDYRDGEYVYYVKPMEVTSGISVSLLPDDVYEAQKLVWKLKQEAKG